MSRRDTLRDRYFCWLCDIVLGGQRYSRKLSFDDLMHYLDSREFTWLMIEDEARAKWGIELRYQFGYDERIPNSTIARDLDCRPCSVLEMMVALAINCEERIMSDDHYGDRTGQWFWGMVVSLGLSSMSDGRFDVKKADRIIDRFLDRRYYPNGRGGLFTIDNFPYDMRAVDIWYQAMWYLNTMM